MYLGIQVHTRHLQEQARLQDELKIEWKKENVRVLKSLSAIGALSPEEQVRVDNGRGTTWSVCKRFCSTYIKNATPIGRAVSKMFADRRKKLEDITMNTGYGYYGQVKEAEQSISKDETEARENLLGFRMAMVSIRDWRPSKFGDFHPEAPAKSSVPFPTNKPSPELSFASQTQPLASSPSDKRQVVPIPLASLSASGDSETLTEAALDNVDPGITRTLQNWASAMESNDPTLEAQCYAEQVDRYYLRLNVTNVFVHDYMETWLTENARRVVKFVPKDVSMEGETETTAKLRLVKHVITRDSSVTTERFTRSRLHLKKEFGIWRISSEQDFK